MNREDIIRMAEEQGLFDYFDLDGDSVGQLMLHTLVFYCIAAERERIIAANAPEIEKINAHFKALEDAIAAERERCAELCDSIAANSVLGTANECAVAIRARSKV